MSKEQKVTITPEMLSLLNEVRKSKEQGKLLDPEVEAALKALDFISDAMESIATRKHIDVAYFQAYRNLIASNIKKAKKLKR